jgi:hypothetical protein
MATDQWEREAHAIAFKIIPLLHGMPLNQARYALQTAETWLLQTHKVDANNTELMDIGRECDHAPAK